MKKILIVFGTRPEAIKLAPLINLIEKEKNFLLKICLTGQHNSMLKSVLKLFNIKPDYNLKVMRVDQNLNSLTSIILQKLNPILKDFNPNIVIVQGDTTTSLASTLAAYYNKIKIAHVEAGLRTGDLYSPWPEEGNRKLISVLADYHYSPTKNNKNNLINDGISKSKIIITGNTVIDTLFLLINRIENDKTFNQRIIRSIKKKGFKFIDDKFILVTGHRRENFGKGIINICMALKELAKKNKQISFIYPVHLNPNILKPVNKLLKGISNIYLIEPCSYEEFILLIKNCYLILTDSGGVQEEAPSLGKPVLVMRNTTERQEGIAAGTLKLVGSDKNKIVKETQLIIDNTKIYNQMSRAHNPYGDGLASKRIVRSLSKIL